MAQLINRYLSDEDYQLISSNKLGIPIVVYKIKSIGIYLLLVSGVILLSLGVLILILLLLGSAHRERETCSLDILYQNIDKLAELIKQRSGLV